MRKGLIALAVLPLAAFSGGALAADAAAGEAKAETCLDCHEAADFEGMSAEEIEASIKDALAGEIKHPPAISEITEADAADVAAWFAAEAGE